MTYFLTVLTVLTALAIYMAVGIRSRRRWPRYPARRAFYPGSTFLDHDGYAQKLDDLDPAVRRQLLQGDWPTEDPALSDGRA